MPEGPGATKTIIAIDIGGSKTRGLMWRDGAVQADVTVGSVNVQNVPVTEAQANLARLFNRLQAAHTPCGVEVYVGAGGIDSDADTEALSALIRPLMPSGNITVVHDTRLVLEAGGTSIGVAVIAGTGSAAWGINDAGHESRAGGWGYLLGDEGSGYWFARQAVRHSLQRMDRGLAPDTMTQDLLLRCGLNSPDQLIAHFHVGTGRSYWAALSPVVFDAAGNGHQEAIALIDEAGRDLASMAAQCFRALSNPGPVVLGGGLGMNQPLLQNTFTEHLARQGITEIQVLDRDPVFGAIELARAPLAAEVTPVSLTPRP